MHIIYYYNNNIMTLVINFCQTSVFVSLLTQRIKLEVGKVSSRVQRLDEGVKGRVAKQT